MEARWTLQELVAEVAARIAALPAPRNGQVRAIPDERTVRYYGTIGLLDRPGAMRGRTALYGLRHVAQVVAIKRLQTMGRSLAEIQQLWPTLDDRTLARMSGVELTAKDRPAARAGFWKRAPAALAAASDAATGDAVSDAAARDAMSASAAAARDASAGDVAASATALARGAAGSARDDAPVPVVHAGAAGPAAPAVELRVELAPSVTLSLTLTDAHVALTPADVRAIRAAAAPLLAELASRRFTSHLAGEEP